MTAYAINNIPLSFQESDPQVIIRPDLVSSLSSGYTEVSYTVNDKCMLISQISYAEEKNVPGAVPRESNKPAQDFTIYHLNLPALGTFPFDSAFWGDGNPANPTYTQKVTVYYRMIAKDSNASGPSVTYRTWTVTNTPDLDGSRYPAGDPFSGATRNFSDIAIAASWEVSDP